MWHSSRAGEEGASTAFLALDLEENKKQRTRRGRHYRAYGNSNSDARPTDAALTRKVPRTSAKNPPTKQPSLSAKNSRAPPRPPSAKQDPSLDLANSQWRPRRHVRHAKHTPHTREEKNKHANTNNAEATGREEERGRKWRTVVGGKEENPRVSWGMRERSRERGNARGNVGTLEGTRELSRECWEHGNAMVGLG